LGDLKEDEESAQRRVKALLDKAMCACGRSKRSCRIRLRPVHSAPILPGGAGIGMACSRLADADNRSRPQNRIVDA
jgi:hypothetical protein